MPLVRAAGDPVEEVLEYAVAALEGIGPPLPRDLDELVHLLSDPQQDVVYWAATLLGRLGERASAAAPDLANTAANHADPNVRARAAWALKKTGG